MSESDRNLSRTSGGAALRGPVDPGDRPGASGHRFGPDLACSECGIHWDAHQRDPRPCAVETAEDVFMRRPPVEGFEPASLTDSLAEPPPTPVGKPTVRD